MKVVMVGSTTFPLNPDIAAEVIDLMRAYPEGTVFQTRGSAGFDQFLAVAADILGYAVVTWPASGGADNFHRDAEMVKTADEVIVFLDPKTIHREDTGTAHLMEKALDQKKPTRAYSAHGHRLVYVGSNE